MILEPNVPKSVRNWAACQVCIRRLETVIALLSAGKPTCLGESWRLRQLGREKFITQVAEPKLRRLKRRVRRCRALAGAIESQYEPQKHLLGKREFLELIGSTLHFTTRHKETFLTLQSCSSDGERICCGSHDGGIDPLDLLSFGFGRA